VRIDRKPDWALVARLVEQAYRVVAPPRLQAPIAATVFRAPRTRRADAQRVTRPAASTRSTSS
jgi:hypothetical protein